MTVAQRQIDHIAALDSIDVEFWSLRNVQRDRLYRASTFTKTDSEWEKAELTFPIPGHPDRNGIFHQGLAAWEGAIGELLEVGVDRILSTLHGESQRKAREEFDQAYTRIWPGRYLREFAADFHVDVPAVDALFTEATRITLERNQMLHDAQSKNEQMIKRDVYLANLKVQESDGPGFGGGGLRVGEFERGLRDLARRFGAGSPEYQLFLAEHKIPYLGDTPVVLSDMSVETSQFIFGQELLKVLNQNDWASIIRKQFESNNTAQASVNNESTPIFTWVEQEVETSSYYVSRPLAFPGLGRVASHNFIVTDAKYLGDPDATVFSFGHNDSGDLGMVDYCTINSSSGSTHLADRNAWLSLKDNSDGKIKFKKINASSEKVRTTAFSVIEDDDYAMFSGLFGVNSNSAAHAVANHFEIEVKDPSLRLAPGAGNSDKIRFGFFVRENGCGSGIHFKEDLDSNPIF
ncbi:hypothetical protein H6770_00205 [Candidatus Peribacteria bacterium]|nr:hypothetical protein [Candidatus Peribacteria bacterium]